MGFSRNSICSLYVLLRKIKRIAGISTVFNYVPVIPRSTGSAMIWRKPARRLVKERGGIRKKAELRGQVPTGEAAPVLLPLCLCTLQGPPGLALKLARECGLGIGDLMRRHPNPEVY
jgi:hypothetical protein